MAGGWWLVAGRAGVAVVDMDAAELEVDITSHPGGVGQFGRFDGDLQKAY